MCCLFSPGATFFRHISGTHQISRRNKNGTKIHEIFKIFQERQNVQENIKISRSAFLKFCKNTYDFPGEKSYNKNRSNFPGKFSQKKTVKNKLSQNFIRTYDFPGDHTPRTDNL